MSECRLDLCCHRHEEGSCRKDFHRPLPQWAGGHGRGLLFHPCASRCAGAGPLAWRDVVPGLNRARLSAERLPRLSAQKGDPWSGFFEIEQIRTETALRTMKVQRK